MKFGPSFDEALLALGNETDNERHGSNEKHSDMLAVASMEVRCYLGDGWYADGRGAQRDYYVAMAMHFYGLLIAAQNPPELADYTLRYRERARLFAAVFIQWFVPDGSALAYGRSLTYRSCR